MSRSVRITCGECSGAGVVATDPPGPCPACDGSGSMPVLVPDPATLDVRFTVDDAGTLTIRTLTMEGSMGTILELANRIHAATGVYPIAAPEDPDA